MFFSGVKCANELSEGRVGMAGVLWSWIRYISTEIIQIFQEKLVKEKFILIQLERLGPGAGILAGFFLIFTRFIGSCSSSPF